MPLKLLVKGKLGFDYQKEEFVEVPDQTVVLEHCLLAVARWESKWKKSFFKSFEKAAPAEVRSYISCMPMNEVDENFVVGLSNSQMQEITNYIAEEQTATTVTYHNRPASNNEILTSELLYYYMAQVPLPFDICERWHLSRLLKTLEIAAVKNDPDSRKKMPSHKWADQQRALNELRLKQFKTKG